MSEALAASPIVRAIGWALLQSLWQGILIGAVTAAALTALRRTTASRRYVVACAGLAAIGVAFVATAMTAAHEAADGAPIPRPAARVEQAARPIVPLTLDTYAIEPQEPPAPRVSWQERYQAWSATFVAVWLAGVILLSMRLFTGWVLVERIRRAAGRPLSDMWRVRLDAMCRHLQVLRPVVVLESVRVHVPTVIGWLRPVVLLPATVLTGLTPAQVEAIIAHELAHIRRHDYALNAVQSAFEIVFFYHPVAWWLSRRIRTEREHCCDDIAVSYCGDRLLYAGALADLEAVRSGDLALALAATDGSLLGRVRRLLKPASGGPPVPPLHALAAVVVMTLLLALIGMDASGVLRPNVEAQSATPGEGRKIPPDEGVIQGRVVDLQTGQPVPGAKIEIFRDARAAVLFERLTIVKSGSSGADGAFEIAGVAPGEYVMVANAPGYVDTSYGDLTRIPSAGRSVRVAGGRISSDVEFRLQPSGIISGRVFADSGEGLPGVEIEVLQRGRVPDLEQLGGVAFAQTEEGGAFRVRGLQPGEYYVRAYVTSSVRPTKGGKSSTYAATFYPDSTRVDDAQRVLVRGGEERFGIDMTLVTASLRNVSGRLVDGTGSAVAGLTVMLHSMGYGGGPDMERHQATAGADGRFLFRDVEPGRYMLMVNDRQNYRRWLGAARGVDVADEDVSGLDVYAETPTHMEAKIVRDGGGPLPFDPRSIGVRIEQRAAGMTFMSGIGPNGRIQSDGTFSIDAGSGTAWIQVSDLPARWIVRSVALDGTDVTDQAIELGAGARRKLEVTLTDRVSGLTGTVTDRNNRPAASAIVLIFPEDRTRWASERLVKNAQARFQGRFRIDDLPPGDYRVIAGADLPPKGAAHSELLDRLWPLATHVHLEEGEQRTLALKLAATAGVIER